MLRAEKDRLRTWLLFRYARWLMRRRFFSVRLYADFADFQEAGTFPLILYGNHSYWWDGLMETLIFDRLELDYYIMMEEKNLRKFRYFQKTGVFGVDLDSRPGRSQALLYAARLLRTRNLRRTLLLYPHGRLVEDFSEWPPFQGGLAGLLRLVEDVKARPLAKKIHSGRYPLPEAALKIGPPSAMAELEPSLLDCRKDLLARLLNDDGEDRHWLIPPPRRWRGRTE
ncbi:MAG: hypothetical protein ACLFRP_09065 [Puniceicoccaceae bacterium]